MTVNVSDVLSVYKKTGGMMDDSSAPASTPPQTAGGTSFSTMVEGFLGDAVDSLHKGEQAAAASVSGNKANLTSVVTAMDNAEVVLDEITAIRDKVITAYQTITSSAI